VAGEGKQSGGRRKGTRLGGHGVVTFLIKKRAGMGKITKRGRNQGEEVGRKT